MIEQVEVFYTEEQLRPNQDFVAIGNDEDFDHAAFIVKYNDKEYEFDFYNEDQGIVWMTLENKFYYLLLERIDPLLVPAFIARCRHIRKHAKPQFGYFYSGESYNGDGIHTSKTNTGERMTCVGFCLNVLKGFLEEDYLEYSDWDASSHYDPSYLKEFCAKHGFKEEDISDSHRRITPLECLTSCCFNTFPIRKKKIDSKKDLVKEAVESLK